MTMTTRDRDRGVEYRRNTDGDWHRLVSVLEFANNKRFFTLVMVYGGIQLEACLANDIGRSPDLGPKNELVGYSAEACDGLGSVALFATDVYQSAGLI